MGTRAPLHLLGQGPGRARFDGTELPHKQQALRNGLKREGLWLRQGSAPETGSPMTVWSPKRSSLTVWRAQSPCMLSHVVGPKLTFWKTLDKSSFPLTAASKTSSAAGCQKSGTGWWLISAEMTSSGFVIAVGKGRQALWVQQPEPVVAAGNPACSLEHRQFPAHMVAR